MYTFLVVALLLTAGEGGDADQPAVTAEQPAPPPTGRCQVHLDFGERSGQQVTVLVDKVKGPDFNITREDDVYYGFVVEKPTRFRVSDDRIQGTVSDMDLMLHVKTDPLCTEVSGLVGIRRVKVKVCANRVTVQASGSLQVASSAHLVLEQKDEGHYSGQFGQGSNITSANMEISGCKLEDIASQPGLIVLLFMWWLGV